MKVGRKLGLFLCCHCEERSDEAIPCPQSANVISFVLRPSLSSLCFMRATAALPHTAASHGRVCCGAF